MQESFTHISSQLPPEYEREINIHGACLDHTFVVLDDDPTGCQTVYDLPVLFSWDVATLAHYFSKGTRLFFILLNTRSLPEEEAIHLIAQVMKNLRQASESAKRNFIIISRSDSTLRGHYPAEVDAIEKQLDKGKYMHCLVPAFFPGGRYTYNDIHYVREGDRMIPAAETPYASDTTFGYRQSNLSKYIEEKTRGSIAASQVLSFSVADLREKGPSWISQTLMHSDAPACFVNAMAQSDLEVFAAGAWEAMLEGKRIIFRTGASFLNAIGCIPLRSPLDHNSLRSSSANGGLIVVGSHVPKTSAQLVPLLESSALVSLELPVKKIAGGSRDRILPEMVRRINGLIRGGIHVMVYTSRKRVRAKRSDGELQIGKQVADALVELVAGLEVDPSFILAKGGITSHEVAVRGLGIERSTVIGQAIPGVPVLVPDQRPGLKYIIFPGNVGDDRALYDLFMKLNR